MEDQDGSNQDVSDSGNEGDTNSQDQSSSGEGESTSPENSDQTDRQEDNNDGGDDGDNSVIEQDGVKYVRQDSIQPRIDALTAKHKSAEDTLNALKDDEDFQEKIAERLQGTLSKSPQRDNGSEETQTQKLLATMDEKTNGFYKQVFSAQGQELQTYIDGRLSDLIKEHIDPIMSHIGGGELDKVRSNHKDFGQYEVATRKIMDKYQGMPPEEAYFLASRDGKLRSANNKGAINERNRQQKINRTPSRKSSGGNDSKPRVKTWGDAVKAGMRKQGEDI